MQHVTFALVFPLCNAVIVDVSIDQMVLILNVRIGVHQVTHNHMCL